MSIHRCIIAKTLLTTFAYPKKINLVIFLNNLNQSLGNYKYIFKVSRKGPIIINTTFLFSLIHISFLEWTNYIRFLIEDKYNDETRTYKPITIHRYNKFNFKINTFSAKHRS